MNIWMRAGLTRYLGRRLRFSREPNNSELLGLAPFHPYAFGPAIQPSKRWRRSLSTESGADGPLRPRKPLSRKDYPSSIPLPKYRHKPEVWLSFLEPYIPQSLRRDANCTARPGASEKDQCRAIIHILFKARALSGIDLLSYLGIKLKRWEALHALMQRLLDNAKDSKSFPTRAHLPSNMNWEAIGSWESFDSFDQTSVNELKQNQENGIPVKRGEPTWDLMDFDLYTEEPQMSGQMGEYRLRMGIMEEIWQSLGSIVLEAADLPPEESRIAMTYAYRILARLHHIDFIPNQVYKYAPSTKRNSLNRPPTNHILSSHIMNVLSDAVWQASEAETAAKAAAEGSKIVPPRYKMRVRELGHAIWLDFILWCCVEGGFAKEGTWILEQMKNRSGKKAWSVKSWDSLNLAAESIHPSSLDRDRLWGDSVKFPGEKSAQPGEPFQGLGERTICSEVVSALMDSLINTMNGGVGHRGNSPAYVLDHIAILKSILEKNRIPLTRKHLLGLIVRITEAGGIVPEIEPQALEHVLKLVPPVKPDQLKGSFSYLSGSMTETPPMEVITNNSAVILGMYQYLLGVYSFVGNAGGTLDTFKTILAYVDAAKLQYSHQFATELKQLVRSRERRTTENTEEARSRLLNLESDSTHFDDESSLPLLGNSSLALLLDLSTSCKAYAFGKWLLCSTDADGPVIPPNSYGDQALAPAIIRFATATKDKSILDAVTERLKTPLANNVLKTILGYKIAINDWDQVAQLFAHIRDGKNGHWGVSNVADLAAAIIEVDKQPRSKSQQHSLATATGILVQLLEGHYDRKQNPAKEVYTYQEEVMYQLQRIFASVPGSLSTACRSVKVKWEPSGRDIVHHISAYAFCNILNAVVEHYGSAEGMRLWEMWCVDPQSPEARRVLQGGTSLLYFADELVSVDHGSVPAYDEEWQKAQRHKALVPDLRTVRVIAQRAVAEIQKFQTQKKNGASTDRQGSDDDSGVTRESTEEVLEWCIETFRKFRLRDAAIDRELEGYLTQWKKKKPKSRKLAPVKTTTSDTVSGEQASPSATDQSTSTSSPLMYTIRRHYTSQPTESLRPASPSAQRYESTHAQRPPSP